MGDRATGRRDRLGRRARPGVPAARPAAAPSLAGGPLLRGVRRRPAAGRGCSGDEPGPRPTAAAFVPAERRSTPTATARPAAARCPPARPRRSRTSGGGRRQRPRPAAPPQRGRLGPRGHRATRRRARVVAVVCDGVSTSYRAGRRLGPPRRPRASAAARRCRRRRPTGRRAARFDAASEAVRTLAGQRGTPATPRPHLRHRRRHRPSHRRLDRRQPRLLAAATPATGQRRARSPRTTRGPRGWLRRRRCRGPRRSPRRGRTHHRLARRGRAEAEPHLAAFEPDGPGVVLALHATGCGTTAEPAELAAARAAGGAADPLGAAAHTWSRSRWRAAATTTSRSWWCRSRPHQPRARSRPAARAEPTEADDQREQDSRRGRLTDERQSAVLRRRLPERVPARGRPRGQRDRHGDRAGRGRPPAGRGRPTRRPRGGHHGRLLGFDGLPADQDARPGQATAAAIDALARRRAPSPSSPAPTRRAGSTRTDGGLAVAGPATRRAGQGRRCASSTAAAAPRSARGCGWPTSCRLGTSTRIRHAILLTDGRNEHEEPERPARRARRAARARSPATAAASAPTGRSRSCAGSPRRCSAPSTSWPTRPAWPPTSSR